MAPCRTSPDLALYGLRYRMAEIPSSFIPYPIEHLLHCIALRVTPVVAVGVGAEAPVLAHIDLYIAPLREYFHNAVVWDQPFAAVAHQYGPRPGAPHEAIKGLFGLSC